MWTSCLTEPTLAGDHVSQLMFREMMLFIQINSSRESNGMFAGLGGETDLMTIEERLLWLPIWKRNFITHSFGSSHLRLTSCYLTCSSTWKETSHLCKSTIKKKVTVASSEQYLYLTCVHVLTIMQWKKRTADVVCYVQKMKRLLKIKQSITVGSIMIYVN